MFIYLGISICLHLCQCKGNMQGWAGLGRRLVTILNSMTSAELMGRCEFVQVFGEEERLNCVVMCSKVFPAEGAVSDP